MSEFEPKDPERELRERAQKIIHELTGAQDTTRAEIRKATAEERTDAWKMHDTVVECISEDPDVQDRRAREKARCKSCADAVVRKLSATGVSLSSEEQIVLCLVMEGVSGQWNEYDGQDEGVDAGKVLRSEEGITIHFTSFGSDIGKRTIPLT